MLIGGLVGDVVNLVAATMGILSGTTRRDYYNSKKAATGFETVTALRLNRQMRQENAGNER